ncbi:MAG TPA: sigma-70 family RNA polymerase sigma factor [Methylomirabilota bacterium]|jgi:RNA polymerase sigma-70 factor, ECF subfamily|nr:sigma-70 family RNA polymerase sigma factor [Methylomirabilota bacterium]HWO06505.1 sigma-70 family RNA polymerase sigma factor [Methylomirabilota bacterium]
MGPDAPPGGGGVAGAPGPSEIDERALIQRCIAGDATAFEPLVEKYRQRVWRLAYQVLHDREEAWDVAQEAFVRAFHSLPSFRGQSAFYTWLFRITVNVATDRHRQRGAQARAFGPERVSEEEWARTTPDPGGGPEQQAARKEQRERIRSALDALPPKARTIIMLSDVEGLSYREIAEVLNCPIGTVMSRLHNARKRLKALLGPMLVLMLWLGLTLVLTASAEAQPVIRFGVRILEASSAPKSPSGPAAPKSEAEPDERLRKIIPRLQTLFRYTDYTTLDRQRVDGPLGTQQRFAVPGERWLEVTPDQMQGTSVRMRVRLLRGERSEMNANILAAPGAPAVLGGPPYGSGVLIIILWANPNP